MASYEEEIQRKFHDAYSEDLQRDILRLLATDYRGSYVECLGNHAWPEAHDLLPHLRRAMLEGQIRELARTHGITASVELNSKGTSYYTLLSSGNVRLTVKAVAHPNIRVQDAEYRKTYARVGQLKLFGEKPPTGSILYAVLLHGPDVLNRARPSFAHIVFPDEDCSEYVERINLFDLYSDLAQELFTSREETVEDDLDIQLRNEIAENDLFIEPLEESIPDELDLDIHSDTEEQNDEDDEEEGAGDRNR